MLISTTETIAGKEIAQVLGVARGSTVRTRHVGRHIIAGLKLFIGGEVSEYTKMQADAREQALQRMMEDAERLGADAVLCVRLQTSMIMNGASEILAYGTAVRFKA